MIVVTKTYTRPSTNVNYFVGNKSNFDSNISNNYQSGTPKIISRTQSMSNNLLTLTTTMSFINQAALTQYQADALVQAYESARSAHNSANGITETSSTVVQ